MNSLNGKKYIGATKLGLSMRLCQHISSLRKGKHTNAPLQSDFLKYGELNFNGSIIAHAEPSALRNAEAFIIFTTPKKELYNVVMPKVRPAEAYRQKDVERASFLKSISFPEEISIADIRNIRYKFNLSQRELAIELKTSIQSISQWETGKISMNKKSMSKLRKFKKQYLPKG
jgi:DNA-binding transcriptional regulator YiaG